MKHLLYVDERTEVLQQIESEFESACDRIGLKINVGRSSVSGQKGIRGRLGRGWRWKWRKWKR